MVATEMKLSHAINPDRIGYFTPVEDHPEYNWAGFVVHRQMGLTQETEAITIFCDPLLFIEHLRPFVSPKKAGEGLPQGGYGALFRGSAALWWSSLHPNRRSALCKDTFTNFSKAFLERFLSEKEKCTFYNEAKYSKHHAKEGVKLIDWVDRKFLYGRSCIAGGEQKIAPDILKWFDHDVLQIIDGTVQLFSNHMPFHSRLQCQRFCRHAQGKIIDVVQAEEQGADHEGK